MGVTLASSGNCQGVLVTADTMDETTRALGGTVRYFGGPLGSASGGYLALTEYASLALAQASPFPIPVNGRVDFPALVAARYVRLYHRSIDASAHVLYEFFPRRLVQADDIEAESIKAINIAAGAIVADKIAAGAVTAIKISVSQLSAITADMGTLTAGLITGANIQTGTSGARVVLSSDANGGLIGYDGSDTYDPVAGTGTYQILWDKTDGKLYAGAGAVMLDELGITSTAPTSAGNTTAYKFISGAGTLGGLYGWDQGSSTIATEVRTQPISGRDSQVNIEARYASGRIATAVLKAADSGGLGPAVTIIKSAAQETIAMGGGSTITTIQGGLNLGTATGATAGQISTSSNIAVGRAVDANTRVLIRGIGTTAATAGIYYEDSGLTAEFYVNDAGQGFLNAASFIYSSDERLKENVVKSDRGLSHVLGLRPKKFDYKDGQKDQIGFLAADVALVLPELVTPINPNDTGPTPLLGMLTTNLIPVLVAAIQELADRLDAAGL